MYSISPFLRLPSFFGFILALFFLLFFTLVAIVLKKGLCLRRKKREKLCEERKSRLPTFQQTKLTERLESVSFLRPSTNAFYLLLVLLLFPPWAPTEEQQQQKKRNLKSTRKTFHWILSFSFFSFAVAVALEISAEKRFFVLLSFSFQNIHVQTEFEVSGPLGCLQNKSLSKQSEIIENYGLCQGTL